MSTLNVYGLEAKNKTTKNISVASGSMIYAPDSLIQTVTIRSDLRTTYSSPTSGNGTRVTALNISIAPKKASSLLLITWMINGEMHQDNVFTIHQGTSLITTSGFEGFNNQAGNVRWSGVSSAFYDRDESSTPSNWFIQYAVPAINTTSRTYAPAVRSAGGTAFTFALNRTLNGATSDSFESMVSTGMVMEIMQ
jgi:hypothetical protein